MVKTEEAIKDVYWRHHVDVIKTGWPDFLMIDRLTGNPIGCVEVKNSLKELRPNQVKMLTALSKVMPTYVVVVGKGKHFGWKWEHHQFPFAEEDRTFEAKGDKMVKKCR